ncbi:MAG: DNA-3-methyladenine glycosylase 2 [Chloroflexi bacterium AL-W]|nr:DNA-3-methyladenine glycosylase 2 [Chloroflexi bacterium AL-N1]NOK67179.1 DNA-3-methyladenine glycosylase 2 [Chloroflexi bacterium AL-N10]NOK75327.1 DNA-3-methyladenine glycosylase 2 [Chloroflexi bacterium AL-N5]NOK82115.1 DNA-3-methyladenine glycosylase 2 [Chloroflexi bacterium AL-W]NOK89960.1 DNA-3-methyladenine glycosylase 2 [Chloroflexi bacterium AL-N15]
MLGDTHSAYSYCCCIADETGIDYCENVLEVDGVFYKAFPVPDQMAALAPKQVELLIGNKRKAYYLHAAAQEFGTVDEEWLRTAPYTEVEAWLCSINGVGAWSAAFVLLRGLGRMAHIPPGEKALLQAVRTHYGDHLKQHDIPHIAEQYGPWQGYWAHYLRVV